MNIGKDQQCRQDLSQLLGMLWMCRDDLGKVDNIPLLHAIGELHRQASYNESAEADSMLLAFGMLIADSSSPFSREE